MPDHGLESFGVRRDIIGVDDRHQHDCIGHFSGVPTVATDHADDFSAHLTGVLQGAHQIRGDVADQVAAADGEHQEAVGRAQPRSAEPFDKDGLPSLIVRPGGQFRNVVGRRIGLEPGDLAEVIDGMRRIGRAAAHAEDEEPAAGLPCGQEDADRPLASRGIEAPGDFNGFLKVRGCVTHGDEGV